VIAMTQIATPAGDRLVSLLLATIGGGLAMLGPGLWSIDARLFGWKRVEAPPRKHISHSSELLEARSPASKEPPIPF
jgi:hypothetical protein